MFTGIVTGLGRVLQKKPRAELIEFTIELPRNELARIRLGDSLAVNGVCLTVMGRERRKIRVQTLPETLKSTNLGTLTKGSWVNLEPSLRAGDTLGGHFLLGHVDGVGKISQVRQRKESLTLQIEAPKVIIRRLIPKGPIAVDGISLTVQEMGARSFKVAIIPYTLEHTNLKARAAGRHVNLEVDLLAKYVKHFLSQGTEDDKRSFRRSRKHRSDSTNKDCLTAEDAPALPANFPRVSLRNQEIWAGLAGVSGAVPARGFMPRAGGRAKRGPLTEIFLREQGF